MPAPAQPESGMVSARARPTNIRRKVMFGLFLLSVVTYLDRVCINPAAPHMQSDLGLSNAQWGVSGRKPCFNGCQ